MKEKKTQADRDAALIEAGKQMGINVTQADCDAINAIRDAGKLNPGEKPSERLFSMVLSREVGRKMKVTFSADGKYTFVDDLPGN